MISAYSASESNSGAKRRLERRGRVEESKGRANPTTSIRGSPNLGGGRRSDTKRPTALGLSSNSCGCLTQLWS